jgi:hypothetical protein
VQSVWSGLRPLATDPGISNTADAVRDHLVVREGDGMITVTGGKWTTYRLMAQDAVDACLEEGGLRPVRGCITADLRLLGATRYSSASFAHLAQVCVLLCSRALVYVCLCAREQVPQPVRPCSRRNCSSAAKLKDVTPFSAADIHLCKAVWHALASSEHSNSARSVQKILHRLGLDGYRCSAAAVQACHTFCDTLSAVSSLGTCQKPHCLFQSMCSCSGTTLCCGAFPSTTVCHANVYHCTATDSGCRHTRCHTEAVTSISTSQSASREHTATRPLASLKLPPWSASLTVSCHGTTSLRRKSSMLRAMSFAAAPRTFLHGGADSHSLTFGRRAPPCRAWWSCWRGSTGGAGGGGG